MSALDALRKDVVKDAIKEKNVMPYYKNLRIARITRGRFKGDALAFRYNFPDDVYAANPMVVDSITTNSFLASTLSKPKEQLRKISKPVCILIGENDDFFDPQMVKKYADFVEAPFSHFEIIHDNCTNISILELSAPYIKSWLSRILPYIRRRDISNQSNSISSLPPPIYVDQVLAGQWPTEEKTSAIKRMVKSYEESTDVPQYQYMETFDGVKLAFQCYMPEKFTSILILWMDAIFSEFILNLSKRCKMMVYRFDVRGTGQSEEGFPDAEAFYHDIKFSVIWCKKNFPGFVAFLGGNGLSASAILNYSSWKGVEHPNSYFFISPFVKATFLNEPLLMPLSYKLFPAKNVKPCCFLSPCRAISPGRYFFKKRASKGEHQNIFRFSSIFLKSTLVKDLLGQLLKLEVPFAVWYDARDSIVLASKVLYTICALSNAPMHVAASIEGIDDYDRLHEIIRPFKSWADHVSTTLNPQPSRHVFKNCTIVDFTKIELIGKGSFGRVWLVHHRYSDKFLALKVLNKAEVAKSGLVNQVIQERDILSKIESPFIVPFVGSFQDDSSLYILMEFLVGGELYTLLRMNNKLTSNMVRFYAAEILVALTFLHDRNIIYRDLKPENILLDALGHVRLIDFGLSRQFPKSGSCGTFCGSPFYMAPEMISSKAYGLSVDIWSFGIVIYELLTGTLPFTGRSANEIYRKIVFGKVAYPDGFDLDAKDLLLKILTRDPKKRLGAYELDSLGQPLGSAPFKPATDYEFDRTSPIPRANSIVPKMFQRYNAIMKHKFFKGIDWDLIRTRSCVPPFQPTVGFEGDTSNFIKYAFTDTQACEPFDNSTGDPFLEF